MSQFCIAFHYRGTVVFPRQEILDKYFLSKNPAPSLDITEHKDVFGMTLASFSLSYISQIVCYPKPKLSQKKVAQEASGKRFPAKASVLTAALVFTATSLKHSAARISLVRTRLPA